MELTDIPGIGPTKADQLQAIGINTVQDLASVDLRKPLQLNIGNDVLRRAKQEARKLLKAEGVEFDKAPYQQTGSHAKAAGNKKTGGKKPAAKKTPPKEQAVVSFGKKDTKKTENNAEKKGFISRLFTRN